MAGEVGDGEDLVAEGGDEEEIDLRHDAGHLEGYHAAEAVGLDEVDGGEETGLAEGVGPGVGDLGFELIDLMVEGDLFECGGGFGEEDEGEVVVGPVGDGYFDWLHAESGGGGEGGAVDGGGGGFLHPEREVAYAKAFYRGCGVEVEVAGDAGYVLIVGAGDGVEDEHGVFDGAGHGAEFVEGPAEGHGSCARDAAEGGAEAGDAAAHGGADDAAFGLAADAEGYEAGGGGCAGACAGTGGAFFEEPGVQGLAAEPDVVEGEGAEGELGDEDGSGFVEALGDGGVGGGDAVAEGFGAVGGGDVGGVEEVFGSPGDAVEWAAVVAGCYFGVGFLCLLEGVVGGEGDDAVELGIELLDAVEVDLCEVLAGELAGFDPAGELGYGGEGDLVVGGWEWARVGGGTDEFICGGAGGFAGKDGVDCRVWLDGGGDREFAGAGAALVEGGHGVAPVACGLGAVGFGERGLD